MRLFEKAKGNLFVLAGPSGVGKTTLIAELVKKGFSVVTSYTTRPMRDNESEGNPYHFISEKEFLARQRQGEFFIGQEMNGNHYGARTKDLQDLLREGKDVLLEIAPDKLPDLAEIVPTLKSILIIPNSFDELKKRMTSRATISLKELEERLEHARVLFAGPCRTNFVVINPDGEQTNTQSAIEEIIRALKQKEEIPSAFLFDEFLKEQIDICKALGLRSSVQLSH